MVDMFVQFLNIYLVDSRLGTPQEGKANTKLVQENQVKQEKVDSSPERLV